MRPSAPTISNRSRRAEVVLQETNPRPPSNSSTPAMSSSAQSPANRPKAEARAGSEPKTSRITFTQ